MYRFNWSWPFQMFPVSGPPILWHPEASRHLALQYLSPLHITFQCILSPLCYVTLPWDFNGNLMVFLLLFSLSHDPLSLNKTEWTFKNASYTMVLTCVNLQLTQDSYKDIHFLPAQISQPLPAPLTTPSFSPISPLQPATRPCVFPQAHTHTQLR